MKISEKFKLVRERLGLSQESLSKKIGVSFATINRIETEKTLPCYQTLQSFDSFCEEHKKELEGILND